MGDFANSVFAFCQNRAYVDEVIGEHAQSDPSLHSALAPVDAAPKTMPPLEDTDAALAARPSSLSFFEPAFLLLALSVGAFRGAIRDAHSLNASLVSSSFLFG